MKINYIFFLKNKICCIIKHRITGKQVPGPLVSTRSILHELSLKKVMQIENIVVNTEEI